MQLYIVLLNWTDRGRQAVRESPTRLAAVKALAVTLGGRVTASYLTLGAYDLVLLVEMREAEGLAALVLQVGSLGNVRTTTLPAFSEDVYQRLTAGVV